MAVVIAVSLALGIDTFLESGRARGYSTRLLAKYLGFAGVDIHSFDRARDADTAYAEERLREYPNVHLHYGDSRRLLPPLVRRLPANRIALLIDGPKNRKAIDLLSDCLCQSNNIVAAFVDDLPASTDGTGSDGRIYAERCFEDPFFTDDPEFVERFGYLNDPAGTQSAKKSETFRQPGNGRAVGVFLPTTADRKRALQRRPSPNRVERLYLALKDRLRDLRKRA